MYSTATRRRSAKESYVSLVTCHRSRQDDAYTSARIDHRVSAAFIDHQRGEYIENETCTRGRVYSLRRVNLVLSWTRVSPPSRVQQSEYLTLASRAIILNSLSPSFNPRSSLTFSCPPHPFKASREQDERRRRSLLLLSHALTTAQLSTAKRIAVLSSPGDTPAAALAACLASRGNPCEHTARSVQPPARSRAPVRRNSCAPGRRVGRFRRNVYSPPSREHHRGRRREASVRCQVA